MIDPSVFAAEVARQIDAHTAWDSLHEFRTLHWDGERLTTGTLAAIAPNVPPDAYPDLMAGVAQKEILKQQEQGKHTLYAFSLLFEAHAVMHDSAQATAEENARFQRDRLERRFHQREDAVEVLGIYLVDVHGRLWTGTKRRDTGKVEQHYYPDPARTPIGGGFIQGLRTVAAVTRATLHGLPMPSRLR
ncbi:hypothetical protein [Streptosporangium carneum]|uniref:Uncharacterized protein n=1 Tax=Streptosporangium carneum TaxID=47481 RepID=A0A9W6MB04_9ACTN|nr:hypothetical protein [Streptosporangium carneum]GLK07285.1 hypothetical protein GCM10017600_06900 [Streptosporangium carneum]